MSSYYAKELPSQSFYVNGKAYKFDLLRLDDPDLIQHFDSAAAKGIGGIVRLTEDEYNESLKKKASQPSSLKQPRGREEFKQKLPNYSSKRFVRSERSAAARDKAGPAPAPTDAPVQVDMSAYIPKTIKGLLS